MKYLQTGRSMLEMLAVLALMGLISFAGLVGYNEAIVRNQAVNIGKDALLRAAAVNALSQSYFVRRLSENAPISLSGFSDKIQDMTVSTKKETNASFIITYTGVPKRVCERVIETNAIGLYKTTVNNADLSLDNMTTICTGATNTISFSFYRAGYTSSRVEEAGDSGSSSTTNPCAEIRCNGCQVCLNGVCVNDSSKCSGCQTCNGICIDDDSKCGSGKCVNGTCYCPAGVSGTSCEIAPECTNDTDCSDPKICRNNTCTCPTVGSLSKCQELSEQNGCDVIVTSANGTACTTTDGADGTCQSGVCIETGTASCENGTIVTGNNGHEYCKSNDWMTWNDAFTWCEDRGYHLASMEEMCPGWDGETGDGKCANLNGVSSNWYVWSSLAFGTSYAFGVYLADGEVVNNYYQGSPTPGSAFCFIDEVTDPSTGGSTHNPGSGSGSTN